MAKREGLGMRRIGWICGLGLALLAGACGDDGGGAGGDAGVDAGSDTDTDVDADSDSGWDCVPGDGCDNTVCWGNDAKNIDAGGGVMRPSWCDGFNLCNLWGGCQFFQAHDGGTVCPRPGGDQALTHCCEGGYPENPNCRGYCTLPDAGCVIHP